MAEEYFDIINEQEEIIGQATRKECHSNPALIHRAVHCWLFNAKGQVLMQQRSMQKDMSPGYWDVSCAGHVDAGEAPQQSLYRELQEELGIQGITPLYANKHFYRSEKQTELQYIYYAIVDKPVEYFQIDESEVAQLQWMDIADIQEAYVEGTIRVTKELITEIAMITQYMLSKEHISQ